MTSTARNARAPGAGGSTVKFTELDPPPPGIGLRTVTANAPTVEILATLICAVSSDAFTNVVGRALPLRRTTAPFTKSVPVTVSVNASPPAALFVGEREVSTGTGLFT